MEILQVLVTTLVVSVSIAIAAAILFIAVMTPLAFGLAFFLCVLSQTSAGKSGRTAPNFGDIIAAHLLLFVVAAILTLTAEGVRALFF